MELQTVTDETFRKFIQQPMAFVVFGAPWCGPCAPTKRVMESLSVEFPDIKFGYLDVDALDSLKTGIELGILGLPTTLMFKNGMPVSVALGLKSKQYFFNLIKDHA